MTFARMALMSRPFVFTAFLGVLASVLVVAARCDSTGKPEYPQAVEQYFKFLKEQPFPGIDEFNDKWNARYEKLAGDVAALGPVVAKDIADLSRRAASGDDEDLGQLGRTEFFTPIWKLPKDELREAGLILVKRREPYTQMNGLWALAQSHNDEDVAIALELAKSKDAEVREYAVYCLGFWPVDLVHDELLALLRSDNVVVRWKACLAAFNASPNRFAEELWKIGLNDPFVMARVVALEALASTGHQEALSKLFELVTWEDPGSKQSTAVGRQMAIEALTRLGAYQQWKVVAGAMDDPEVDLEVAAIRYLVKAPDKEARQRGEARMRDNAQLRDQVNEPWSPWAHLFGLQRVPRAEGEGYLLFDWPD
jgi:HEAT repeat protein